MEIKKICPTCQREFAVPYKLRKQIYCSLGCCIKSPTWLSHVKLRTKEVMKRFVGAKRSKEACRKISEAKKEHWKDPALKEIYHAAAIKGGQALKKKLLEDEGFRKAFSTKTGYSTKGHKSNPRGISKALKKHWEDPIAKVKHLEAIKKSIPYSKQRHAEVEALHSKAIMKTLTKLREKGYLCVQVHNKPRPDIVAFKDGKISGVEIDEKFPPKNKYKDNTWYDEIIFFDFDGNKLT
jgi:hypothetical protein